MTRFSRESVDRFLDYNLHMESRTIYLGDSDEGEINGVVAGRLIKAIHLMVEQSAEKPIKLYINSFGGCWFNGLAIYDCIKACPCEVDGYIIGSAMSMGSIVVQACDTRIMYPNATMMVHDGVESISEVLPSTFQNWAEYSKYQRTLMYRIYAERSGRPPGFWRKKCSADLILSAPQALAFGLIDRILE